MVRLLNFFADAFGAVTDGVTIWFIRARVVKTVKDKIVWSSFKTIDYNSIVDDKKSISYFANNLADVVEEFVQIVKKNESELPGAGQRSGIGYQPHHGNRNAV